jgi:hypothetical protein
VLVERWWLGRLGSRGHQTQLGILLVFLMLACSLSSCDGGSEFPQQRAPVLETVVSGNRVVPQDPDGAYAALPTSGRLQLRVQADWSTNISVSVDGQDLPRREGRSDDQAWFDPTARVLTAPSRKLFWNIEISVPPDMRSALGPVQVEVLDNTLLKTPPPLEKRPPLTVQLINLGNPRRFRLPSDFFNKAGDNTKEGDRAKDQVVVKGVVLAGWLWDGSSDAPPSRTGTTPARANSFATMRVKTTTTTSGSTTTSSPATTAAPISSQSAARS